MRFRLCLWFGNSLSQDALPAMGAVTYFVRPAEKQPTRQRRLQAHQRKLKLTGQDIQIGGEGYVSQSGSTTCLSTKSLTQQLLLSRLMIGVVPVRTIR